jgi:hypothetical protein
VDEIDFSGSPHLAAIAKILDLARWPHHCVVTNRAMQEIVRLRLTKEAVLESVRSHLSGRLPTYALQQQYGITAYVLLPCSVGEFELYVKVQVPPCQQERDEVLVIISAHKPEYESKRKVNATKTSCLPSLRRG